MKIDNGKVAALFIALESDTITGRNSPFWPEYRRSHFGEPMQEAGIEDISRQRALVRMQ